MMVILILLLASSLTAASPAERVPDPLKPWTDWVRDEEQSCPYLDGQEEGKICAWPSVLKLSLSDKNGRFVQQWRVYADAWVALPGDDDRWPQDVTANNRAVAVIHMDGHPSVFLKAGDYSISGSYEWETIPESFQIPKDTGVFHLTVRGASVPFPSMDENGLVWLQGKEEEEEAADSLEIRVHRHVLDEIPLVLTTHIVLDVSGKTREVMLGPAVLDRFVPMNVDSPLPLDLRPDGAIRVQARAGHWEMRIAARHQGPVSSLALPARKEGLVWADEEVWAFQAKSQLRLVNVEGVSALDPQQTTLPEDWKALPAYRMTPGETMRFAEQRRGDSSPAPDQLALLRNYWLDFDGTGYTINDFIQGVFSSSHRLDMNSPMKLGRVSVNGDNQLITSLPGQAKEGIEIRFGQAQIVADSRIEDATFRVPAIGWDHNFQKVTGVLHLPPGWKLLAATGADDVPATWINRWTLLQIFLVLILTVSFARLWGKLWGVIAFFTFVLTFPEYDSPQWIWFAALIGVVLLRLIQKGKLRALLKIYRLVTLIILIVIAIPFMVEQVRSALYPSSDYSQQINLNQSLGAGELERQIQAGSTSYGYDTETGGAFMQDKAGAMEPATPPPPMEAPAPEVQQEAPKPKVHPRMMEQKAINVQSYSAINPRAQVQTGPGLPRWVGTTFPLQWTGPVDKTQSLRFYLIPPWLNFILSMLRVLLLALLALCLIGFPGDFWPSSLRKFLTPAEVTAALCFLCFLMSPAETQAEFPSQELLNELQQRLSETPQCYPECSSISRMQVDIAGNMLRIRLQAGTEDETAIPLPGSLADWSPQEVLVDGQPFSELLRTDDGNLWLKLAPGSHQVVLQGPLPNRSTVQLPLPMKPHHVAATLSGWTLDGLQEDGMADENLQFTRVKSNATETQPGAPMDGSGSLPPFVTIYRRLILGMSWQMETRVVRMTGTGTAVILAIPLLEGESVTTAGLRIQDGKVQVNMAPQSSEIRWNSVLKETGTIRLKAAGTFDWAEVWQLDASPLWHVTPRGIPVIHQQGAEGTWMPEWHPWPGETVEIAVIRPEGVKGQTVTIDQSVFSVEPGQRYSKTTLNFSLRSSLGGQHTLTLPPGAELHSVSINGTTQPIRQMERKVTLPLVPGEQRIELQWQQPGGIRAFFRMPAVGLGLPSVNSELQIHLPTNRWIFFAGGPSVGPAVMFWAFFVVLALVAAGLGRVPLTPLRARHWLLLGLGLSQLPVWASLIIAAWLLALGWRKEQPLQNRWLFDLLQIGLVPWTLTALVVLFVSIKHGLLGGPDMQIQGNNSSATLLRWFQDRSPETLLQPWVISLPLYWYRISMLLWALWLALALIRWLKWAWQCYSADALWRPLRKKRATPPPMPPGPEAAG